MFNGINGAASAKDDFAHSAGERHERSMVHRTTTVKYAAVASSHSVALANGSQVDRQVYASTWWMGLYGGASPKRQIAWSNARTVRCLDLGVLCAKLRKKLSNTTQKTSRSYINKQGKKGFHGTAFLKSSQKLTS